MRTMKYLALLLLASASILLTTCDMERYGCTDPRAGNFDIDADVDDGSCYYGNEPGYGSCQPAQEGNLVITNRTGEALYLYKDYADDSNGAEAYISCIPADTTDFLVNISNPELSVCLLQIWKASDVPISTSPDMDKVYRQWRVALSNSTSAEERANWLITGSDDVTGTGTLFLSYPDIDEMGYDVIYQVDIYLNSKNGAKIASLQAGIEDKMVSVDYGVHYLFFHYWYSNPNSATGEVTDIGWIDVSDIVINDSHREASIDIPVFNSIVGKYAELTVRNENDFVINVVANGNMIEDIAMVDGSTQGLSSIPAGDQTTFLIPVDKYNVVIQDLGGKVIDQFTGVYIIQEENTVVSSGVETRTIRIMNTTNKYLGLFNIQEEFLGLPVEVGQSSAEFTIPASYDSLLVVSFDRTKMQGFYYNSYVTVFSLRDYIFNRIDIIEDWPQSGGVYVNPVIDHDQSTTMLGTLVNSEAVWLTFEYNVSSEEGYDLFKFDLDGYTEIVPIGGETGWLTFGMSVNPGSHTLEWTYTKDQTRTEGSDQVQIRNITIE
ncbi:MAG: hypothetical protein JW801_15815 [Bacteroidales bacterium]|nr:hypothetical protein [Bacteroidales bacterium]